MSGVVDDKRIWFDYDNRTKSGMVVCSADVYKAIRQEFSVPNKQAGLLRRKGFRFVQDRNYLISPTCRYPVGMTQELMNWAEKEFPHKVLDISDKLRDVVFPELCVQTLLPISDTIQYRDYQQESIACMLKAGRGIIEVGTGGGKTIIMCGLCHNLLNHPSEKFKKILIIVPDIGLVGQSYKDFTEYNASFTFSKWTGDHPVDNSVQVIIANRQILYSQYEQNKSWIDDIDAIIVDEVHGVKAKSKNSNVITKLIKSIKTPHKFGMTGTLHLEPDVRWSTIGAIGSVLFAKTSKELRDEKYLSDAEVVILKLHHTEYTKRDYNETLDYIFHHKARNEKIKSICTKVSKNILVIVDRLEYGFELYDTMKSLEDNNKQVFFIRGEVEVSERMRIISLMEHNDNVVVIAMAAVFSVGINIKNLHYVLFGQIGKSFIRTIQTIGRGVRLHETKNKVVIFDLVDQIKYMKDHAEERQVFYKHQQIDMTEIDIQLS